MNKMLFLFMFWFSLMLGLVARMQPDRPLHGTWDFKPHVEWQTENAGKEVLLPGSLLLDEQGQVWYLDYQEARIHLFSSQGRWIRTFGRPGEGPGDLNGPFSLFMAGPELGVNETNRVSFFSQQGKHRACERLLVHGLQAFGWVGGQRLACRANFNYEPTNGLETVCIFDLKTKRSKKLIDLPVSHFFQMGSISMEGLGMLPSPVTYCDGQRIVCGFSATYAIHVFDAEGRLSTTIELDRKHPPISLSERESIVRNSGFDKYAGKTPAQVARLLPSMYIHFNSFFTDTSGRILVQCPNVRGDRAFFDIFGPQGDYLYRATLIIPVAGEIMDHAIVQGRWAAIVEDDSGDLHLVLCSLNWPTKLN